MWWAPALKFLGGNWKILGLAAIGVVLFFKLEGWAGDYLDKRQAERNELRTLTAERDRAVIERESAEEIRRIEEEHKAEMDALRDMYMAELAQVRADARAERAVLEDRERIQRLANAKPGLIELRANAATQRQFDELEAELNR